MIAIDYSKLAKINSTHGLNAEQLNFSSQEIEDLLRKIKSRNQGFYDILDDTKTLTKIQEFITPALKSRYKFIVVLGIGGSALGTITLKNSLKHEHGCQLGQTQLIVLDNIDPDLITEVEDVINLAETLFIVVSKSGGTVETLSQYNYFRAKIEAQNLAVTNHFIFITDPKTGLLREISQSEKITAFDIPENVGGRFSVLTPVSLLPAALIGLDIEDLIKGAKKARQAFFALDPEKNPAYKLAKIQYLLYQKQKVMNVIMPYSTKLAPITAWYAQLLAESIGKEGIGITPVSAKGVTDQHSQNQLYHDGPNDKLLMFIQIQNFKNKISIPETDNFPYLKNTTFNELLELEMQGTIDSLTAQDRPTIKLSIPELSEKSLGALFFMFQASVAFLGEMFKVNAYDQPGVELSKQLTKQYYERKA
jgi:glucose-6-phosphate isomerase